MNINWNTIKKWLPWAIGALAVITIAWLAIANKNLNKEYDTAVINNKAFISQLDSVNNESVVFKTTIDQLTYFNDSITKQLLDTKEKLKIDDNKVNQLARMQSQMVKTDTVVFIDTIFKNPTINIDTTIGDEWVSTTVHMEYPSKISVSTKAKSVKNLVIYSERETVDPPKKFFIARWFQKKHTVIKATVEEKNPYIYSEKNVFYQINND